MTSRRFVYTGEHLEWLRKHYQRLTVPDLAIEFSRRFKVEKTPSQIRACLKNHKITCGGQVPKAGSHRIQLVSREELAWLKDQYINLTVPELTDQFNQRFDRNVTAHQLRALFNNHGIKCPRTGRFEPGKRSWNAGTKGVMKPNSGSFQPGPRPDQEREMYAERQDKDGYTWIKIPERDPHFDRPYRWVLKHQWLWQQAGREIPPKHVLMFLDSNPANLSLDNIACIHRRVLSRLNHANYKAVPIELKPTILAACKIEDVAQQLSSAERGNKA